MIKAKTTKKKVNIYRLIDPVTMQVRYIGATVRTLKERLHQHKHNALKHKGTHKSHWLRKLYANGYVPIMELIEICNINNYCDRENFWINYYGFKNLTNARKESAGIVINRSISSKRRSAEGHYKPIVQLTSNGEFVQEYKSVKEASEKTGIGKTALGNCLHGRCHLTGGYHWVTKKKYDKGYIIPLVKSNTCKGENHPKSIAVKVCFTDNTSKRFGTIEDGAKYLNISARYLGCIIDPSCKAYGNIPKKCTNVKSIIKL